MNKRISRILLLFLIVIQIMNIGYWGAQKKGYHIDEIMTYLMTNGFPENRHLIVYDDEYQNHWHEEPRKYILDAFTVQDEERFDFEGVAETNSRDVHPPLFYYGVHFLSSLFPDQYSKWFGIVPNILYFIVSQLCLYALFSRITGSFRIGLLIVFVYGINAAAISTTIFIRMYAMLNMWAIISLYCHMRIFERMDDKKWIAAASIVTMLGLLTQYYFIIFQFFISLYSVLYLMVKKQWKPVIEYVALMISGMALACLYYPAMLQHIMNSGRGVEAVSNLVSNQNSIIAFLNMINEWVLNNHGIILLGVLLCLVIAASFSKNKRIKLKKEHQAIFLMVFAGCGYLAVISKIAPYVVGRYVSIIPPIFLGVIVCLAVWSLDCILDSKRYLGTSGIIVFALIITIGSYKDDQVKWVYPLADNDLEIAKWFGDEEAIVVHDRVFDDVTIFFELKEYNRFYSTSFAQMDILSEAVRDCEDGFVLYLSNNDSIKDNLKRIEELTGTKAFVMYEPHFGSFVAYNCYPQNENIRQ